METLAMYLFFAGMALNVAGWLWLLVAAFRQRVWWGLGVLLLPPLALIFLFAHWRNASRPFLACLAGSAVLGLAFAVGAYGVAANLGPLEREVDGELHVTLTGWDRHDYSVLEHKPAIVVLQMANADVTDETLRHLRGLRQLRELDLNNTQVSDEGLNVLKELPNLQFLKLQNTRITDAGFRASLATMESLERLDLRGTDVNPATARGWREAKNGRRVMR
jgi:Leucine-rich repeat (LRR) protein